MLDLTFVAEEEYFGARVTVELCEGGRERAVTEANKREYVQLITAHRMTGAIRAQIGAFTQGFHDLVPHELVAPFNAAELELLISGLPEIDVDDLARHTEYQGYSAQSPVIAWWWAAVRGLSREDLARLVMFFSGSSRVPLGGFANLSGVSGPQRFQIHKSFGAPGQLPTAHTVRARPGARVGARAAWPWPVQCGEWRSESPPLFSFSLFCAHPPARALRSASTRWTCRSTPARRS